MASEPPNPVAQPGKEGFTISSVEFSSMAATLSARRPGSTALSLGASPKAKRSQRVAPADASRGQQRDLSVAELTTRVHELNANLQAQATSVTAAIDAIDDHANRLDTLWGLFVRLDDTVGLIAAEVQNNDNNIKETVEKNNTKVKKGLCELERSVTARTAAIPALKNQVKGAITQVTELIAKASSGQTTGVSLNVSMVALESRFQKLQEHTDYSLKGLETVIIEALSGQVYVDDFHGSLRGMAIQGVGIGPDLTVSGSMQAASFVGDHAGRLKPLRPYHKGR